MSNSITPIRGTITNPFGSFFSDRFFDSFFNDAPIYGAGRSPPRDNKFGPRYNVQQKETGYIISIAAPGVSKEDININIETKKPAQANLKIRIPGWARNKPVPGKLYRYINESKMQTTIKINGELQNVWSDSKGYVTLSRRWENGDNIEIKYDGGLLENKRIVK